MKRDDSKLSVVEKPVKEAKRHYIGKGKPFPKDATFPAPVYRQVKDDGPSRNSWKFFDYWKSIAGTVSDPKDRCDLIETRWYLEWPKCEPELSGDSAARPKKMFEVIQGPLWFDDPMEYLEEVPKRLGSGEWNVYLNEANVHGELMSAHFSAIDLDKYPPKVDLKTLVTGTRVNERYIRWLSVKGIKIPGEATAAEEEDMANTDALNIVANVLKDQTQTAIETTKELADVRVEAAQEQVERMREEHAEQGKDKLNVTNEGIRLITDVAREVVTMAREDRQQPQQINPVELVKTVAELMRPPREDSTSLFLGTLTKMQESNQDIMRMAMGMRKTPEGVWMMAEAQQQPQAQRGSFEDDLTKTLRIAEQLGYRRPGEMIVHPRREENHEPPPPPEKSFWAGVAENPVAFIAGATTIVTLLANIVYNVMAKDKPPMAPQEALQRAQQQQQPSQQPGQPLQQRPPQNVNLKDPSVWVDSIRVLEPTIKAHFQGKGSGLSGFSFAEYVLSNATGGGENQDGRRKYMMFKEHLGPGGFDVAVKMVPSLAEVVNALPQAWQVFLGEFFSYDELEPVADTAKVA
jgi:hypothetical protein